MNTMRVAFPSAARAVQQTYTSDWFENLENRGALIILDVSAVTATPALTVKLQAYDPVSLEGRDVFSAAAAVATAVNGVYLLYPGAGTNATLTESVGGNLPTKYRVAVTHGDTDSATYSVVLHELA